VDCGIDAVASDAETPRRVVLVVTDGMDNISNHTVSDEVLKANSDGVMVYAILMNGNDPNGMNRGDLGSLSRETGGGFFVMTNTDELPATFARVSEELRHQYVFGFSPAGGVGGQHKLEVTAHRPGSTTRAQRVYMTLNPLVARPAAPLGPAPQPATIPIPVPSVRVEAPSVDLSATLEGFENGEWSEARAPVMTPEGLQNLLRSLQDHAPAWIATAGAADQRRRRLAVATFTLQVLYTQIDPFLWLGGGHRDARFATARDSHGARYRTLMPAAALLDWAGDILKPDPPLPAERWWHLAAIALLERSNATDALNQEIDLASSRFPTEERWTLARAISQELPTWPDARDSRPFDPSPETALPIEDRYQEAIRRPSIKAEAEVRLGYFELRRGRVDAALKAFNAAGASPDGAVKYWLGLFQGQALERKQDAAGAIEAYGRAVAAVPYAQTAAFSLAAALAGAHRGSESAALTARALSLHDSRIDPWTIYTLPDMRFWDRATIDLRAAIARPK
jgi:tetratricopeptide (TPR) repeat protein